MSREKIIATEEEPFDPESMSPEQEEKVRAWYDTPNNFSRWFPKIKDCGIEVPESKVIQIPARVIEAFFDPLEPSEDKVITEWVRDKVMPEIKDLGTFLFIKNGTYSDKYDFSESCFCRNNLHELISHITNICYDAELCGAGGLSELVVRKFAGDPLKDFDEIPCIYKGMPLRPEFRIFYDFDKRRVLYSAFYWDWDYCRKEISRNETDRIVYEHVCPSIEEFYHEHVLDVEQLVSEHMKNVDISGKWSIDIMYSVSDDTYYLIDMALAQTSAYWDPCKAKQ